MISLIIIEVTQKIRIMETIMNRIFQKFLQSVIDLSSVGAKCREDNTHDIDMNPDAEVPIPEWKVYFDGNFWEPSGKGHAGTELRLNKQFEWAGHHWIIPAGVFLQQRSCLGFLYVYSGRRYSRIYEKVGFKPRK